MAGQRDVERPHRPDAVRRGRAALALTLLAAPAATQASLAGLQQTWAAARDGFGDELAEGSLTREDLRQLLARFEASQEQSMLANRIALEAAVALKDLGGVQRATAAWFPAFTRVRAEAVQQRELGRYDRSRRLLEGARELLPGDSPYQPYLLQALAIDTCVLQEWETTLDLVAQAIERLPEAPAHRRPLLVDLLVLRADTLLDMGLPDLALEPVAGALEEVAAMRAEGLPAGSAALVAERARAEYLNATDRYERLIEEVEGVLSGIESEEELSERDRRVRSHLLMFLGVAHAELGAEDAEQLERAEHLFRQTLAAASDPVERFTCQAYLGWISLSGGLIEESTRWVAAAREGLVTTAADPYCRGFLAALEGRLALATEDPARIQEQRAALESSLEQMIATWEAGEMRPGGLALLRYSDRRFAVATLIEMVLALEGTEGPEEALRILYRVTGAGTLVRRLGVPNADLRSYRESLPPGGGALVYLVGRDRSHVFALERDRLAHAELAGEWPLWNRVEALQRLLALDPQGLDESRLEQRAAELQRAAQDLSRALLPEPIAARVLTWESLVVIGSDLLYEPAFECLPLGGQPLGTTRALSYAASMPLASALAERAAARTGTEELDAVRLLAGVRPPPGSGLAELPLGTEQAQRLTGAFGARAELLLGSDATHARLADGLGNVGALVILSHGLRDPTNERPSQILLAGSGGGADPLSCDEVEALSSPPVVFLGVCGSARGPAREGTGPAGHLGGAFLLAGADAVVLSDADLSLAPTVLQAEAFLARVRAGDGPAAAMRQARLALLAAGWSDPHHWGLMRVVGLGGGG